MYKIEKGIPIPPRSSRRQSVADVIRRMELGDSIKLPSMSKYSTFYQAARQVGAKLSIRRDGSAYRAWRVA